MGLASNEHLIVKIKFVLKTILAMTIIESYVLISSIWPPILVNIYKDTLYWLLLLYAPLLVTIPLSLYISSQKSAVIESQRLTRKALRSNMRLYIVFECIEFLASTTGSVARIYYYSECSIDSNTTCRTTTNNAASLSLMILNFIAMGVSIVALLSSYLYLSAVDKIKVQESTKSPIGNRVKSENGFTMIMQP
jgi:hypothetical protein